MPIRPPCLILAPEVLYFCAAQLLLDSTRSTQCSSKGVPRNEVDEEDGLEAIATLFSGNFELLKQALLQVMIDSTPPAEHS